MFRAIASAAILLCLIAASMPAQASPVIQNPTASAPTTLYMHIDGIQDFPINTQPPDDRFQTSEAFGLATSTLSCLPTDVPGTSADNSEYHTYYGYSTPGYVEYDFEEQGKPRYHKERGISFDAELDTSYASTAFWYLETQITSSDGEASTANSAPLPLPQVTVRATMRAGDQVGVGDEAYNAGAVIAQGQAGPYVLDPTGAGAPGGLPGHAVGDRHVYEFAMPLAFESSRITRDDAYNVRIDVFIELPECGDPSNGYAMPNTMRVHTSPDFRPRIDLATLNPIRIDYLHPQFIGDELVIHTSLNSPWGNYDVAETEGPYGVPGGIRVAIDGPTSAASLAQAAFVQRHHDHHFHQEPVDVTYVWPYLQDGAAGGQYTVTVEAYNDQQTGKAIASETFEIGKDGKPTAIVQEQESPAPGALLLVALAAVALVRRRSPGAGQDP